MSSFASDLNKHDETRRCLDLIGLLGIPLCTMPGGSPLAEARKFIEGMN